jgi:hypothetical protein
MSQIPSGPPKLVYNSNDFSDSSKINQTGNSRYVIIETNTMKQMGNCEKSLASSAREINDFVVKNKDSFSMLASTALLFLQSALKYRDNENKASRMVSQVPKPFQGLAKVAVKLFLTIKNLGDPTEIGRKMVDSAIVDKEKSVKDALKKKPYFCENKAAESFKGRRFCVRPSATEMGAYAFVYEKAGGAKGKYLATIDNKGILKLVEKDTNTGSLKPGGSDFFPTEGIHMDNLEEEMAKRLMVTPANLTEVKSTSPSIEGYNAANTSTLQTQVNNGIIMAAASEGMPLTPPHSISIPPPIVGQIPPPIVGQIPPPIVGQIPPPIVGQIPPPILGQGTPQIVVKKTDTELKQMTSEELFKELTSQTKKPEEGSMYSTAEVQQRFRYVRCAKATSIEVGDDQQHMHANKMTMARANKINFVASQAPIMKGNLNLDLGEDAHLFGEDAHLFWRDVYNGGFSILDLTNKSDSIEPYYPTDIGSEVTIGSYTIKLTKSEDSKHTYQITDEQGNAKTITRYNYNQWPDFGAPDSLNEFSSLVNMVESEDIGADVWVHCRAGVGRTGTLITGCYLKQMIESGDVNSGNFESKLLDMILELRKQRDVQFVQASEQFDLLLQYGNSLLKAKAEGH